MLLRRGDRGAAVAAKLYPDGHRQRGRV
jgi:hypothetical protein